MHLLIVVEQILSYPIPGDCLPFLTHQEILHSADSFQSLPGFHLVGTRMYNPQKISQLILAMFSRHKGDSPIKDFTDAVTEMYTAKTSNNETPPPVSKPAARRISTQRVNGLEESDSSDEEDIRASHSSISASGNAFERATKIPLSGEPSCPRMKHTCSQKDSSRLMSGGIEEMPRLSLLTGALQ